jgi:two-component system, NtrC family, response regulator AtoC
MLQALLFSDDTETIVRLSDVFRETGFAVQAVATLPEARGALLREMPDVAVIDYEALGPDGILFLQNSRLGNVIELILMTADPNLANVVQDLRAMATETFAKPPSPDRLKSTLERIVDVTTQAATDNGEIVKAAGLGIMHGNSPPMRRFFALVRKVSRTDMTVLLVGESGVGKELGAQMIHALGDRSKGPLVAVNCGAISPEILESELFGHEKGSFTGANRRHVGLFERASGGTLFLDEVTEMSPALQVKLLRALESGRVRRVGGEQELPVDVRIVAATNRDPDKALQQGMLREDLYYRLAQFPIRIPPLRERGDDILVLADRFLAELNAANRLVKKFSPKVLELLRLHSWPGNVRELRNAVGRAYVLAAETIEPDDLPPGVVEGGPIDGDHLRLAVGLPLAEVERRAILTTVEHLEGDKKAAAEVLGVSLKTLYTKLKQYRGG